METGYQQDAHTTNCQWLGHTVWNAANFSIVQVQISSQSLEITNITNNIFV